jgi:LCP family protein required for cell wall assembly
MIFKKFGFYISLLLAVLVGFFGFVLYRINILPTIIFSLVMAIMIILLLITAILLCSKGFIRKLFGWILVIVLGIVSGFGTYYLNSTYSALDAITGEKEVENSSNCYVLRAGTIVDAAELEGKTIGYLKNVNTTGTDGVIAGLNEQGISFQTKEYESSLKMVQDLKGMAIDAMILNQSYLSVVADFDGQEDIEDEVISVYSYTYAAEKTNVSDNTDVTTEPFTILISGIDTYGAISEVSRSDVNLLVTVNPSTRQIFMLSIPRDYYVETACDAEDGCANGQMDKLTHTGLHGIKTTEKTLENLLDVEINYNVRVNFSTLVDLVDVLGGITVSNPTSFTSRSDGFYFEAGEVEMDGEHALEFARERYSFSTGDRERGRNQMRVLTGIINKALSPAILANYTEVLSVLSESMQTNMPMDDITALIKMQLSNGGSWNITTYSLNGSDGNDYAYELGSNAYVMYPNETTVANAVADIKAVENGEVPPFTNSAE